MVEQVKEDGDRDLLLTDDVRRFFYAVVGSMKDFSHPAVDVTIELDDKTSAVFYVELVRTIEDGKSTPFASRMQTEEGP